MTAGGTRAPAAVGLHLDHAHRRHVVGSEPVVLHCHHYNTFLQRSIQDAFWIDSTPFLTGAATEVAYRQLSSLLATVADTDARISLAEQLYAWSGFGAVDMSDLGGDGGVVTASTSHYGLAWRARFGPSDQPMDLFTVGWLAGAAAAIFNSDNGGFRAEQTTCLGMGSRAATYELCRTPPDGSIRSSVGLGPLTDHKLEAAPPTSVDYGGIYNALTAMPIEGDDQGLIPAFGVYLTRHYANYYNRISFEFERAMSESFGEEGIAAARPLLVEAGHVCAFNTFGGIMKSAEWDALIRPSLASREDWAHGIVAAVNALGWGRWQLTEVSAAAATFVLHDDYESVGHLAMYGKSDHHVSYLAQGAAAGIMNLIYIGDIASKPDLTPGFYSELFRGDASYKSVCAASRSAGDDTTVFNVVAPA